jgi:hypothetical protein
MKNICILSFEFLNFFISLPDYTDGLPHFLVSDKETIVVISGLADRNAEFKIFVTGIGCVCPDVIINSDCLQVGFR